MLGREVIITEGSVLFSWVTSSTHLFMVVANCSTTQSQRFLFPETVQCWQSLAGSSFLLNSSRKMVSLIVDFAYPEQKQTCPNADPNIFCENSEKRHIWPWSPKYQRIWLPPTRPTQEAQDSQSQGGNQRLREKRG